MGGDWLVARHCGGDQNRVAILDQNVACRLGVLRSWWRRRGNRTSKRQQPISKRRSQHDDNDGDPRAKRKLPPAFGSTGDNGRHSGRTGQAVIVGKYVVDVDTNKLCILAQVALGEHRCAKYVEVVLL
ncbi:MAG: hypothetical protein IIA07_12250 [Proteobacteria bacterium]|nr:hypothetical protein [Pseudomonadota bacterium]